MTKLFIEGGVEFMGMLSIVLLISFVLAVKNGIAVLAGKPVDTIKLGYIKSVGLFGLVLGMLGQFIGLFTAFEYISKSGSIAPGILAGGFKVSSICNIYGMIIFLLSYLLWFGLDVMLRKKM